MSQNQIIMNLKPSGSAELSRGQACWVRVERSGDGKTLRFVRFTCKGFEVFKTCAY